MTLSLSIALGIVTHFVEHLIEDDVIVIFQPAEEGPGGAEPMMRSEEYQAWKPDLILALHIAPEYPVGKLAITALNASSSVSQSVLLRISVKTLGGTSTTTVGMLF